MTANHLLVGVTDCADRLWCGTSKFAGAVAVALVCLLEIDIRSADATADQRTGAANHTNVLLTAAQQRLDELRSEIVRMRDDREDVEPVTLRLSGCESRSAVATPLSPLARAVLRALGVAEEARTGQATLYYGGCNSVWVSPDVLPQLTNEMLLHELVHAYDDQTHGIVDRYLSAKTTDERLAFLAEIEGSAVVWTQKYRELVGSEVATRRIAGVVHERRGLPESDRQPSSLTMFLKLLVYGNGAMWKTSSPFRQHALSTANLLGFTVPTREIPEGEDSLGLAMCAFILARGSTTSDHDFYSLVASKDESHVSLRGKLRAVLADWESDRCSVSGRHASPERRLEWRTEWTSNRAAQLFARILETLVRREHHHVECDGAVVRFSFPHREGGLAPNEQIHDKEE